METEGTPGAEVERSLRATIAREGPITFARFMAETLYHPTDGYYSSGRAVIGRRGDYFTSVSVGPIFGRMLAGQFAEIWEKLGQPGDFTIVEQGAHDGQLAADVLGALREREPELSETLRYRIVEPFPVLAERQQEKLETVAERVEWVAALEEMQPFSGVHFSNELLDSMPVHLLAGENGTWRERFVEVAAGEFAFVDRPVSAPGLLQKLPEAPNERYETEVNLAVLTWIDALAPKLRRGVILIADYGFVREEFYALHRKRGTLQSYAAHRVLASPLVQVGASDRSAHVEWTSLAERAEERGLTIAGFADQHHFLTGLLAKNPTLAGTNGRALQTLLHPEFLGTRFQFLGLTKEFSGALGGFRFALSRP
ncbi:MAG: class I SAM-dependent methyltransferase [Chthoniobacterales bacterium]